MNAMEERKRHISFGLPGRLSISGFSDYDSGVKLRGYQIILLLFSTVLIIVVTLAMIFRPSVIGAAGLPSWSWPVAGTLSAAAAHRRPVRAASAVLMALWIALGVIQR